MLEAYQSYITLEPKMKGVHIFISENVRQCEPQVIILYVQVDIEAVVT